MTPTHVIMHSGSYVLVGAALERCKRPSFSKVLVPPTVEDPRAIIAWKGKKAKVRVRLSKFFNSDGKVYIDTEYKDGRLSYVQEGQP